MKDLFGLIAALPLVAAAQSVVTYNLDFATSDGPVTGTLSLVDVTAGYITASDVVSYDFTGPSGLDAVGTSATCMTGCPIEAVGNTLVWSPPEDFVGSNNLDNQYTFSVKGATFGGNIGIGPDGCYPSYGTDTCGGAIFVTNPGMVGELGLFFDEVLGTSTAAVANPAPEIDESGAIAALTLYLGMLAAMSGRGPSSTDGELGKVPLGAPWHHQPPAAPPSGGVFVSVLAVHALPATQRAANPRAFSLPLLRGLRTI